MLRPSTLLLAAAAPALCLSFASPASAAPTLGANTPLPESSARSLESRLPPVCTSSDCWTDGIEPQPQGVGLRRVFLNFSGVTLNSSNTQPDDATTNRTWMITDVVAAGGTLSIPPFNANDLGNQQGATRQEIIDYTVAKLREYHEPYNIEFTTTRPSSGTYHMVVFGGTCTSVIGESCAGIAPLDCNDFTPSNIVFAFPSGLRAVDLATTATQELAHAFGLSHTLDETDFMYPQIQNELPYHYGEGPIPNQDQGPCGNGSYQDSHEKMLSIVGFPGQDATPPSVLITAPSNGQVVKLGDAVAANISDDNPITRVELLLNNEVVATKTSPPFGFNIPASSPLGQVFVDVRATDSQDNTAGHRVTVYIGTGNEEPCVDGQCPEGFSCTEMLCYPDNPVSSGALGDICSDNQECDSSTCAEVGGESRCSQTCNAENLCPEGFECLADTACWPKEEGGGDGGLCSISGSGPGALSTLGLLFLAILFGRRGRGNRDFGHR